MKAKANPNNGNVRQMKNVMNHTSQKRILTDLG